MGQVEIGGATGHVGGARKEKKSWSRENKRVGEGATGIEPGTALQQGV
jgi:hypothetical protein